MWALCQQNCESFCIAVNQMQVSSAIWPCDRNTFKSKISHKEETKLPWNAKIQETDPLFSLQFGVWCFIYANHQNFYVPFGCWISLWKLKKNKKQNKPSVEKEPLLAHGSAVNNNNTVLKC